jgi:hypothetical protein
MNREEIFDVAGDFSPVTLECEVSRGIEDVSFYRFKILAIGFGTGYAEHKIALTPHHQGRWLELSKIGMPFIVFVEVGGIVCVQQVLNFFIARSIHSPLCVRPCVRTDEAVYVQSSVMCRRHCGIVYGGDAVSRSSWR